MLHSTLDCDAIDGAPEPFLRSAGTVFQTFDAQDSGNVSYGVLAGGSRYFVKTAGSPDDARHHLDHPARVAVLRDAAGLAARVRHPSLPALLRVIESAWGPLLVYEWLEGELLGVPAERRALPDSAFQRFRRLPPAEISRALDTLYDLHHLMAREGLVAVDFYDGCLIYDFAAARMQVVDLDHYRPGPFENREGRMLGSTRFMSPEEHQRGAIIDEQTTVFIMGRTALVLLSDGTADAVAFRGSRQQHDVAVRACCAERSLRHGSMAAFVEAWRAAPRDDAP